MKATIFPLALLVAFVASTAAQPLTFRTGSTNTTGSTTSARSPWDQARLKSKTLKQSWPQRRAMFSTNSIASSGALNKDSSVRTRKGVANTGASAKSTVVERGVHHQIVRSVSTVTNLNGVASFRTNTYTELATGMNYQESGEWKKTRELIEPFAEGAIARLGPHKVIFAANLNSPVVIDFETPDGKRLRSRVLGLSYFDASTGDAVLIAETQDSEGQIVGSNQVIFTNAFDGVDASVQYVYRKDGFQQNIVLHAPPPPPTEFKLNPATTRLQVLTEFFDPPAARTESLAGTRQGDLVDVTVDFGQMSIGAGRAFALGQEDNPDNSVIVSKQWTIQDGRTFLVEQVPYERVDRQLKALATRNQGAAVTPRRTGRGEHVMAALKPAPPQRQAKSSTGPMLMAKLTEQTRSGFVLDYELLASQANFTFKGDTTYYVSSAVNLSGVTTIEGGAVVKFASGTTPKITITGTVECKTSAYHPAIFASKDDDSLGEVIDGSTGFPLNKYGNGLTINVSGSTLKHLRFVDANSAIRLGFSEGEINLAHLQFMHCLYGVDFNGNYENTVNINNALFYSITNVTKSGYDNYLRGQHLTIDHCLKLFAIGSGNHNGEVHLTNSVLANVVHRGNADVYEGTHNGFYLSPQFGTTPITATVSPFQTAVAGEHYLTDASGFRSVGNASIAANMLTDLKTRTTHPPIVFPTLLEITGELALFPQVPRYTSGSPDLGYHYDVLDYIVPGMVVDGGTITVQPGTAIGFLGDFAYWETWGFGLGENSALISEGTPTKPNTFASIQLVQEGLAYNGVVGLLGAFSWDQGFNSSPPQIRLRFSNFYLAALDYVLWAGWGEDDDPDVDGFYYTATSSMNWSLRDCSIYGGRINLGTPEDPVNPAFVWPGGSVSWNNNLFERVRITLDPSYYWHDPEDPILMNLDLAFAAYNNLFRGGRIRIRSIPATQGNWVFKDNLFDKVRFKHHIDPSLPLDHDNNGYWPCTTELLTGETAKLVPVNWDTHADAANDAADFTAAPSYQTGPFGRYYLPTSQPLYNAGSRTPADAGLFHYTSRTDQVKDGEESGSPNNVNIGLHYVAAPDSSTTQPKDSDNDGIPDFVENWHGDGDTGVNRIHTADETDWNNPTTDGLMADAESTIYDDVDLDGDGMVGRIEKALETVSLTPDNPLTLMQSNENADEYQTSIDIDHSFVEGLGQLQLNVDGRKGSVAELGNGGVSSLTMYKPFHLPGPHVLQPKLTLLGQLNSAREQPAPTILTAMGRPHIMNSDAIVQFDPFYCAYDSTHGATLHAELTSMSATYTIEIQSASGQHVRWLKIGEQTSTGVINQHWDLKDDQGNDRLDDSFNAVIQITPAGQSAKTYKYPLGNLSTHAEGDFTIAYAWDNPYYSQNLLRNVIQYSVVDPLIKLCHVGGCPEPYDSAFNKWSGYSGYPVGKGDPGMLLNDTHVNNLVADLTDMTPPYTRNFYFFGHGNTTSVGDGDMDNVHLTFTQVCQPLGNYPFVLNRAKWPFWSYRFVFMQACNTATDNTWSRSFGIYDRITTAQLTTWPERAQAFLGFVGQQIVPYYDEDLDDMSNALGVFFAAWQGGFPLEECIRFASMKYPPSPFNGFYLHWNFGPDVQSFHPIFKLLTGGIQDPRLRIYGYAGLTRTGFQPGYDESPYYK